MPDSLENFAEMVRASLVNPRRNLQRAFKKALEIPVDDELRASLRTGIEQIVALETYVATIQAREYCTCACGHTHVKRGKACA